MNNENNSKTGTTSKPIMENVIGLAISLALLFAFVWFVSKAWAAGQN